MLLCPDQPTPPFNSPYQQHASRPSNLHEQPYPSPARTESRSKRPHGLGLYDFQQSMPTGLPPSPQPSEAWNSHYSTGASPLMTEALADPWTSGAFDHPVSRSPLPWNSAQTSPRSSLSSYTREMSVFSHEGSEAAYPVKLESSLWGPEVHFGTDTSGGMNTLSSSRQTPMTVAPERLNAGMYAYDNTYASSTVPKYEPATSGFEFNNRTLERAPSEESYDSPYSKSRSSYASSNGTHERTRNRRHTDPAHAAYRCPQCPEKGFARRYNYNQHMLTHDSYRKKDNICRYPGCGKEFVRKTDLTRHDQSVHQQSKPYRCNRCPSAFSRKDTLRRHEEDGCPRRNQFMIADPHMLSRLPNDNFHGGAGL